MRYIKIFYLTSQHVLEYKARSFVWFLIALLNPLLLLLFWRGVTFVGTNHIKGWNISTITSYYLLITLANAFLQSHINEDIARDDVRKGELSVYLLKPISYFWKKFIEEIPYRVLQGCFGIIITIILSFLLGEFFITNSIAIIVMAVLISIFAMFMSFTFKMILGLLSLWLIDIDGFFQLNEMFTLIFAGFVIPLYLFPPLLANIAYILPYSYMIYFPIIALQGKLTIAQCLYVLGIQGIWLILFFYSYKYLWINGKKKYSGAGQ